jgi:4-hydroxybenzoyl-CoA thioesterase
MTSKPELLVHRRVLRFGDCDAAGVMYTPRAFDFAMEALESFYRDVAGATWYSLPGKYDMAAPTVHYSGDFMAILRGDTEYEIAVRVAELGRSSVTYIMDGTGLDGTHYFRLKAVSCFISLAKEARAPVPVPDDIRTRIQTYQAAHPLPEAG